MKKTYLSILASFLFVPVFAQITGGGVNEQAQQQAQGQQAVKEKTDGLFPKKLGFISISTFKPELRVDNPTAILAPFNLTEGSGNGLKIDFGGYRYFAESIGMPNFNIALYSTFGLAFNTYNWTMAGTPEDPDDSSSPFAFIDYKLGPAFSYQFREGIGADLYFNLGPVVSLGSFYNSDDFYPDKVSFGIKSSLGVNFRLYKLLLGLHKDLGKMKYTYTDDIDVFEPELTLKQTRFSIGLLF